MNRCMCILFSFVFVVLVALPCQASAASITERKAAIGKGCVATGDLSTAMGSVTTASGSFSTTMGQWTTAGGDYSFAGADVPDGPAMVVKKTSGNVGIGTNSPSYKLHVNGSVAGTSWTNLSSKEFKEDIRKVDETSYPMMLAKLMDMNLTSYKYKAMYGGDGTTKLGFIAEDMPEEILSKDGKGVDVYALLTLTIGAMKAQQKENEVLKAKLMEVMRRLEVLEK